MDIHFYIWTKTHTVMTEVSDHLTKTATNQIKSSKNQLYIPGFEQHLISWLKHYRKFLIKFLSLREVQITK